MRTQDTKLHAAGLLNGKLRISAVLKAKVSKGQCKVAPSNLGSVCQVVIWIPESVTVFRSSLTKKPKKL